MKTIPIVKGLVVKDENLYEDDKRALGVDDDKDNSHNKEYLFYNLSNNYRSFQTEVHYVFLSQT